MEAGTRGSAGEAGDREKDIAFDMDLNGARAECHRPTMAVTGPTAYRYLYLFWSAGIAGIAFACDWGVCGRGPSGVSRGHGDVR